MAVLVAGSLTAVLAAVSVMAVLVAGSLTAVLAAVSVMAVLVAGSLTAVLAAVSVMVVVVAGSLTAVLAAVSVMAVLVAGSLTAVLLKGSVSELLAAVSLAAVHVPVAVLSAMQVGRDVDLPFCFRPFPTLDAGAAVLPLPTLVLAEPLVAGVLVFSLRDVGNFFCFGGGGMSLASLLGTLAALLLGALQKTGIAGTTVPVLWWLRCWVGTWKGGPYGTDVVSADSVLAVLIHRARLLGQVRRWRHPPVYRPLVDLLTMEERHLIVTYRLDRATIHELCAQLPDLMSAIRHPTGIHPQVQVLSVLHFLASGSFQTTVAIASGMSQPMFSNVLSRVLSALLKHMRSYIVFPQVEDLPTVKGDFYALGHIHNIIGAIDVTHVALVSPCRSEQVYRNQKSYHSMNVQMVCLADQYISHVNGKFPGSVHNAYILRNRSIPYVMGQFQRHRV
ncbi:hypothetical protein NDU88_005158 [Pleurodeles waltl]|uniref:DDE Tnp4 domain-containing protein n=1 Tax=Pleurodeles waltl TaxID=8319 RepID=A0AAV7V4Z7_PLEWA|nr:hypothetical protein NDU88_005158 [Pleurodeles waltl]